ncbi:MAG TPA: PSD1 and planctomycete cytochrome C domain-containing protein [Pirellulales bacterium]|jgi:hypothetical protein
MPRLSVSLLLLALVVRYAQGADQLDFRTAVAPVLERTCVKCHHGPDAKGGLDLSTSAGLTAGGESGASIAAGRPANSLLLQYVSGPKPEMPRDAPPLSAAEVVTLERWIAEGASWPQEVVLKPATAVSSDWWSLKPLAEISVPTMADAWICTPVDAFILAKLREQQLHPSSEADPRTLVRRLSFDLLGLPPAPEDVERFSADPSEVAYMDLVERYLSSPRYGERWGRYWLDVVHFGESHGYDKDKPRPNAWPYRDYVVRSLNDDKSYNRFMAEQIAGDVLGPDDPLAPVATGFIVAGPWDFVGHVELREGTVDKEIARSNDRDDMVANAMSTFTSLTVHCARCHDHKFDPIPQQNYYALQAVFAGVERADRPYAVEPAIEARRAELASEKGRFERELKSLTEPAGETAAASEDQIKVLKERLEGTEAALRELPATKMVYAAASQFTAQGSFSAPAQPRPIHMLARGDVQAKGALVAPAGLACITGTEADFKLDANAPDGARRAALARWLVDPQNAIVRRSIVNRVWQYHFGQGIVDTPNDFGHMGSLPSHPELLDWLTRWFQDQRHSLKGLHRLLVTSSVYRQSSQDDPARNRIDSGNRYFWRANRQRLDAEALRDSMLAVTGRLDVRMGGPSVQQFLFKDDHSPVYDYASFDPDDARGSRRSIYRFLVRSVPDPFMECLDCADPSIMTPKRNTTLTSIQALALLNNPFVLRQAEHFAARLRQLAADTPTQIDWAYRLALSRQPKSEERQALCQYAERHSLAAACRVLFNSNEFCFVD